MKVKAFRAKLEARYGNVGITLFGSKARNDADSDSDIDLLILTDSPVNHALERTIRDLAFDIELEENLIFGLVVMNREYWDTKRKLMPLRWNIDREEVEV